jgi:hypothetical protein
MQLKAAGAGSQEHTAGHPQSPNGQKAKRQIRCERHCRMGDEGQRQDGDATQRWIVPTRRHKGADHRSEHIVYRPVQDRMPPADLTLAWRRDETSAVVEMFVETVREMAQPR